MSPSIALTIILKLFKNYFSNIFRVQYIMKLVYDYRSCMLSKLANRLFTSSTFSHVKSTCARMIFSNSAYGVFSNFIFSRTFFYFDAEISSFKLRATGVSFEPCQNWKFSQKLYLTCLARF